MEEVRKEFGSSQKFETGAFALDVFLFEDLLDRTCHGYSLPYQCKNIQRQSLGDDEGGSLFGIGKSRQSLMS